MKTSEVDSRRVNFGRWWLLGSIMFGILGAATWGVCRLTPPPVAMPEAGVILDLPESVASLRGKIEEPSSAEKTILPPDTQFAKRVYKGENGPETLTCQIVLSGNDRRSIHRPEACLRGQGWTILNGGTFPVELSDGSKIDVMKLIIDRPITGAKGEQRTLRSLYLYWFASKTSLTPLHHKRLVQTYLDLLLEGRANRWAYIIVNAPVLKGFLPGGKDEAETLALLTKFISEAAPQFQRVEALPEKGSQAAL